MYSNSLAKLQQAVRWALRPQGSARAGKKPVHVAALGTGFFAKSVAVLAMLCLFACSSNPTGSGAYDGAARAEQQAVTTPVYQINCGGAALSPFAGDKYGSGGGTDSSTNTVSTAGVVNAAPAGVYQSERYGNQSYTFVNLTAGASYTVRLHFAETFFNSSGSRVFNVLINGTQVISNLDVFATVGQNKALVKEFTATASSAKQIAIQYVSVKDNATNSGIEILASDGASNAPPTVATPAAATSDGNTSTLSVLGADDGGESNLSYNWSTTGTPPGSVSFSVNASNAAKSTTATFSQSGSYSLLVTITDGSGASTISSVNVTATVSVAPDEAATGGTPVYQINCGGSAIAPFAGDQYGSGGGVDSSTHVVSTSGVANAAPAAVYQTERYGNQTYTFGNLSSGASYTVRLHFAETWFTKTGARRFNVTVNGVAALSNFDVFATAGANKALVRDFSATATSNKQIVVQYTSVTDNATNSGIEILSASGSTVNQAPTVASAASAKATSNTTSTLSVLGADDGGEANLTYTWSVSGTAPGSVAFSVNGSNAAKNTTATFGATGSYTLSATIKDASGASTTSNVTFSVVGAAAPTGAIYRINCGGPAVSPFATDQYGSGGGHDSSTDTVSTTGVANAAPAAVYQSERYGDQTYTFGGLTAGATYTVRLHFAETYFNASGSRVFNVSINGTQVISNLDVFAMAGADKALVLDFGATASSASQLVIQYVSVTNNATNSGIEILSGGSGGTGNSPPSVATPAAANTSGKTSALSVLGADDGGEANLSYTWSTTGTPPGTVSFSANGSNAAKNSTATFSKAGSYALLVTIKDVSGAAATSSVNTSVNQTLTSVTVSPSATQVATGGTRQFTATAFDQFNGQMTSAPAFTWAVSGGGSIDSSGSFSAGSSAGGPFTVTATSSNTSGTANVTVTSSQNGVVTYSTNFDGTEQPISEGGIWNSSGIDWTPIRVANGFAFGTQSSGSSTTDDSISVLSGFPPDQSASAVVHLDGTLNGGSHEAEILLRFSISAHDAHGYECNLSYGPSVSYTEIVRWNGPLNSYTYLSQRYSQPAPKENSVFTAKIVGNLITVTLDGVVINSADITSISGTAWTTGNPGMGFWHGDNAPHYAFTSYSATSVTQ